MYIASREFAIKKAIAPGERAIAFFNSIFNAQSNPVICFIIYEGVRSKQFIA
ncbi:hypothetical protein [Chlorogloeopsis sp. ULAP01]|uniref:hypothetical protein n=1 Tax=Chlorogloeopsis sp. ULAP01 TaxID=3056483 RepID=UPI0025AD7FB9|nr:hypothetical protein [Chlorogloeopsis sp. ULAP01]